MEISLISPYFLSQITKEELLPNIGLTLEFKSYPVDATAIFMFISPFIGISLCSLVGNLFTV
jgi:hypothetical protein